MIVTVNYGDEQEKDYMLFTTRHLHSTIDRVQELHPDWTSVVVVLTRKELEDLDGSA